MPRVSVVTPLQNGGRFIERTIRSVQAQTFSDYEHLIVDNLSTDDGPRIAREFARADSRIVILENRELKGAGPTRNRAIAAARGDYIAFLDSDDAWMPLKLERQIGLMERGGIAFSWTAYDVVDGCGVYQRTQRTRQAISYQDLLYKRAVIGCLTAVYDARQLGKRFMNHLPMRQDFCLWLDVLKAVEEQHLSARGLDEVLAEYRVHSSGISSGKLKAARMQWRAYREHVDLGPIAAGRIFASYAFNAARDRLSAGAATQTGTPKSTR